MKKNMFLLIIIISFSCYPQTEKTLWDMAFDDFLIENAEQLVLYTTINYINPETNDLKKVLFVYKLSDSNGIIIYTNGEHIINYFNIFYSNEYNTLIWNEVNGGLFAWKEANDIVKLVLKSTLQIIVCKNLRQLVLPNDGIIKF